MSGSRGWRAVTLSPIDAAGREFADASLEIVEPPVDDPFIPLKFSLENTELEQKGLVTAESPSTYDLRVIAVSRLLLANMLNNVSVYWVALGKKVAQVALSYGGNDMVGTAFSEEIFKAAGKATGTSLQEMASLVREIKREPAQRDTFFNIIRRLD